MRIPDYIKRLILLHRPYWPHLALAFFAMIVTAATEPAVPYLFQLLLDHGFAGKPDFPYWLVPVVAIGIFVVRGVSTFTTSYMLTWVSSMILNVMRRKMFARMLDIPVNYYATQSVGNVINSIMYEVQGTTDMVTRTFTTMVRSTLTVLGLLAWLLYLNWKLSLITFALIPFFALVVRYTGARLKRLNRETLAVNAQLTQAVEQATRAHQVIKIFGGQPFEKTRFEHRADNLRRFTMKTVTTFAATVPITQTITAVAVAVVVVIALYQSASGEITVGGFVSFLTAMLMLLAPLKQLAEVNGPLQRGMAAAESVFRLIDAPSERTTGKKLAGRAKGQVDFIDVSFTYPSSQQPALKEITLHVEPGETIAFVGMSGGGKTTLVNLLPGFYPILSGQILLDGENIEDIFLPSLRSQIAMVSQHVVLFNDTVAANIAYGDLNPDPARIEAAVKAAYLADVIAELPEGLQTQIGDNGFRLSGGQRQRLAIARAIYKDAPLLILDEATSALDTESERMVQTALERLMQGRTTFVIAHRLSTIERADRIVVLSAGSIVETGTHAELLQKNGAYANLYHLQFSPEMNDQSV